MCFILKGSLPVVCTAFHSAVSLESCYHHEVHLVACPPLCSQALLDSYLLNTYFCLLWDSYFVLGLSNQHLQAFVSYYVFNSAFYLIQTAMTAIAHTLFPLFPC